MKKETLILAMLFCAFGFAEENPADKLRLLHFGNFADTEVFNQAELTGKLEAAKEELITATDRLKNEQSLWAQGFGLSIRVHQAEMIRDTTKLKIKATELELEASHVSTQIMQIQMKAASGESVDLAEAEKLYQSLLPLRCKREARRSESDQSELSYYTAYVRYLQQHPTLSGLREAEDMLRQLKARIASKKGLLQLCEKEFGAL